MVWIAPVAGVAPRHADAYSGILQRIGTRMEFHGTSPRFRGRAHANCRWSSVRPLRRRPPQHCTWRNGSRLPDAPIPELSQGRNFHPSHWAPQASDCDGVGSVGRWWRPGRPLRLPHSNWASLAYCCWLHLLLVGAAAAAARDDEDRHYYYGDERLSWMTQHG